MSKKVSNSNSSKDVPFAKFFNILTDKYPKYKSQIQQTSAVAAQGVKAFDAAAPMLEKAGVLMQKANAKAKELHLKEYVPMLLGLTLCFFGGSFCMLIAVVETVRLVCWEDLKQSFAVLKRNYDSAKSQNLKDNLLDLDGNGIADVLEIEQAELLSRKIQVFMKSVNMDEVQSAWRTLMAAFFSVIAALRVRAVRAIALAGSLAKTAKESIPLEQWLSQFLPVEHQKWSTPVADAFFGSVSVLIAFTLRSTEAYVHAALRGSSMFVRSALKLGRDKGLVEADMTLDNPKARILIGVVAVLGLLFQMANKGALPFPANILLLPLTVMEWSIRATVSCFM